MYSCSCLWPISLTVLNSLQRSREVRGPLPRGRPPYRRARAQDALQGQEAFRLRGRRRQDQGELVVNQGRPMARSLPRSTMMKKTKNLKNNPKSQKRVTCYRLTAFSARLGHSCLELLNIRVPCRCGGTIILICLPDQLWVTVSLDCL